MVDKPGRLKRTSCALFLTLLLAGVSHGASCETEAAASSDCPRAMSLSAAEIEAEAVCLLRHYVQIDTTNPPGNELASARFLAALLAREGITATLYGANAGGILNTTRSVPSSSCSDL